MNNYIIAQTQEVSYSYCDYSHHCTSGVYRLYTNIKSEEAI